jgi:hypothetical protein
VIGRPSAGTKRMMAYPSQSQFRAILRGTCGVFLGIVVGLLVSDALQTGAGYAFPEEQARDTWQRFVWGEHYGLRVLSSLVATAAGCWVAGLVARSRGFVIGALAALPTACIWGFLAYARWKGTVTIGGTLYDTAVSSGHKWGATLLALATIPVAAVAGRIGSDLSGSAADAFDRRRHALLGVSWYHWLWGVLLVNAILVQTGWIVAYALRWFAPQVLVGGVIAGSLASVFLMGILATLGITANGLVHAYRVLAGFEPAERGVTRSVLKYGVGLPVLAIALQEALVASHFGLARLLRMMTG